MTEVHKLSWGAKLITEKLPHLQSIAIGIWVGAGAVNESAEHAGISHFLEHMSFKGTKTRTAKDIVDEIESLGGQINAFTGKEATCYYVRSTSDRFEEAAGVLVDMLMNSQYAREEMNRERKVVIEEIKMTNDTPDDLAIETSGNIVFKGHPLGNSITGTPTSLSRINTDVMKKYVKDNYTADRIVISVAGNFDTKKIKSYFEKEFKMRRRKSANNKLAKADASWSYKPRYSTFARNIEQSHISLAVPAVSMNDRRYFAFMVMNNAFGGTMGSRLFQNIREERGLAYSVYSHFGAYKSQGTFDIYAGVSHNMIEDALEGIAEELQKLAIYGLSEKELETSKAQMRSIYTFSMENVVSRMMRNGSNMLNFGKLYSLSEILKSYEAITLDDVDEVKELVCDMSNYSGCIVSNKKQDVKKLIRSKAQ